MMKPKGSMAFLLASFSSYYRHSSARLPSARPQYVANQAPRSSSLHKMVPSLLHPKGTRVTLKVEHAARWMVETSEGKLAIWTGPDEKVCNYLPAVAKVGSTKATPKLEASDIGSYRSADVACRRGRRCD